MKKQLSAVFGCMVLALLVTAQTQAATSVSLKWTFTMEKPKGDSSLTNELSSPAIGADGTIYVGSTDKNIYALDPSGCKKWSFATGGVVAPRPMLGPDGTIYAGSVDKKVYALNPDGSQKWSFTTEGPVYTRAAIGPDGTIHVGAGGKVYALNPDGSQKWSFAIKGGSYSFPAVGPDGMVYVAAEEHFYALNPNGSKKWSFTPGNTSFWRPAIGADGTIYVASEDNHLYALNPRRLPKMEICGEIRCALKRHRSGRHDLRSLRRPPCLRPQPRWLPKMEICHRRLCLWCTDCGAGRDDLRGIS
jgi:outer membrane protein assembly factor BamB